MKKTRIFGLKAGSVAAVVAVVGLLAFAGCDTGNNGGSGSGDVKMAGTAWVYELTRAEFIAVMTEDGEMSQQEADAALTIMQQLYGITFPMEFLRISFTAASYTMSMGSFEDLENFGEMIEVGSGTYTVDGNTVTLKDAESGVEDIVTVSGNTMTVLGEDGEPLTLKKK